MGGAHAVAALAYGTEAVARVDVIAGPGNLYVQEAKRQVSGERRASTASRPQRRSSSRRRDRRPAARRRSTCSPRPSTGPRPSSRPTSDDPALLDAVAAQVAELAADARRPIRRRSRSRTRRRSSAALAFAEAFAPEHLELVGAGRGGAGARGCARAGCVFVGARGRDRVRRLRRRLEPLRCPTGGAARFASGLVAARVPPPHGRGARSATPSDALARRRRARSPAPRASPVHARVDGGARCDGTNAGGPHEPRTADDRPRTTRRDRRPPRARARRHGRGHARTTGVGFLDHMLDLLARHGRLDLDVEVARRPRRPASHHTVEDTGHRARPGARPRRSATARGSRRYGHAVVPMDEARATCAIDISGRPLLRVRGRRCPPGVDRRLRPRAGRGVLPRGRQHGAADAAPDASRRARTPTT